MSGVRRNRLVVLFALAIAVTTALPASAQGPQESLAGVGLPAGGDGSGTCDPDGGGTLPDVGSLYTIVMSGSLEGCWYTDTIPYMKATPSGVYMERGTETFVGCLMDGATEVACGSFSTTYKFTSKWDADGEIHGRCQHPIVSGTGDFAGVTGRVDFKDDVETGEFNYKGHLTLDA